MNMWEDTHLQLEYRPNSRLSKDEGLYIPGRAELLDTQYETVTDI